MNEIEKQKWIYSQLVDEESRFIYAKRIQFNLDNDYNHIKEILERYLPELIKNQWYPGKEKELVSRIKESKRKVVIFGAGYLGEKVLNLCVEEGITVECFCDNDEEKHNTILAGVKIIKPIELIKQMPQMEYIIIISTKYAHDEIFNELINMDISEKNIYKFVDYSPNSLSSQYFDSDIIKLKEDEVFVDAGCFNFETSRLFLTYMSKLGLHCKKIYAFEPDSKNIQRCEKNIKSIGFKNVELRKVGIWNENTVLHFLEQGNGTSHVSIENKDCIGTDLQVVSLDECILEPVTFIKMDIEGAEYEALEGAKHILKKDKPKLAVCLYHKKDDMWRIPYLIKSLVPEYRLYIRHYSNYEGETVLYAI